MKADFDIAHRDSLIRVDVRGVIDEDGIRKLWTAIADACENHDCYDILGVSDLDRPFSTFDALSHVETFKDAGITLRHRIAWVNNDLESREVLWFTETLLLNRSQLNGALFESVEEARQWLLDGPDSDPKSGQ